MKRRSFFGSLTAGVLVGAGAAKTTTAPSRQDDPVAFRVTRFEPAAIVSDLLDPTPFGSRGA